MRNIADAIEQFIISELFANEQDRVDVKRSQLAEKLSCAPSQITYTLTTRFTPERGYEVESKRGNGGFIRIIRLPRQTQAHPLLPSGKEVKSSGQLVQALAMGVVGMLITDEPGVYLPGWGGLRIEDTVLVTATGSERLTKSSKQLVEIR